MSVIRISIEEAADVPRKHRETMLKIIDLAARAAAQRLKAFVIMHVDELGITDRGLYKNGLVVYGSSLHAEAPHSGIVELGARPHPVSREGVEAIAGWVRRKLGVNDEGEALSIAYAISKKIEEVGQEPRYVMRDCLPKAKEFFAEEFQRLASREHRS